MYPAAYAQRVNQYTSVQTETHLTDASPHRLIQMLMEGFLARVNSAIGAVERKDYEAKSLYISKAAAIIGGLDEALDKEKGGEIAENLSDLYTYIKARLLDASRENSTEILTETSSLMREIKLAWDVIEA